MKKIVKFASLFLAASLSLCLCLAGCTDGKTTSGGGSSLPDYDALENELAVTITGWIAPDTIGTEEQMQLVKDVGIDTLFLGAAGEGTYIPNVNSPTEGDRSVYTLMEEYGIRAYLNTNDLKVNELLVDDMPFMQDIDDFMGTIEAAGIHEFLLCDTSTALMEYLHYLMAHGWEIAGSYQAEVFPYSTRLGLRMKKI